MTPALPTRPASLARLTDVRHADRGVYLITQGLHLAGVGDIHFHREDAIGLLFGGALGRVRIEVRGHHGGAARGQGQGDGASDTDPAPVTTAIILSLMIFRSQLTAVRAEGKLGARFSRSAV